MTTPLLIGKEKDFPDQSIVEPPVRTRTPCCCSSKLICAFVCTAMIFGSFIMFQGDVTFHWESTDLDWKSQNSTFVLQNHNFLKIYSSPADKIHQVFWYCKDLSAVVPECDWVTTQTLVVPDYKIGKELWGGQSLKIRTINEDWDKHVEVWPQMIEACRYGLLMIFWTMGGLRTPTYDVCIE